ncbi:MAG: YhcH/YjgK/YiaL family protein, partial [Deltaproteobacteria bacterium]|nr:YhcH/YjgK/YiaL family protein [Deltaproteobacteria bacterium]
KYPIDGDRVFASVESLFTQDEASRRFEAHRRYLDIQLLLAGREKHLYAPDLRGMVLTEDLLAERDLAFYASPPSPGSFVLAPGHYAVYFPGEPHCPCCAATPGGEAIRKIVFKILWAD